MFCGKCGKAFQSDQSFCARCGNKVAPTDVLQNLAEASEPSEPEAPRKTLIYERVVVSRIGRFGIIVVAVAVALVVAVLALGNNEISKVDALKTQISLSSFVEGTASGTTRFELKTHDECPADLVVTDFLESSESWYKNSISGQSYSFFQEVFATASEDSVKELASVFSEFTSFCDTQSLSEGKYVLSKTTFGEFGTIRDVFGLDLEGIVLDFKHCDNMSTCWGDGQFADARVVLAYRGKVAMLIHYSVDSSGYPVKPSPMSFDQIDRLALSALEDFDG